MTTQTRTVIVDTAQNAVEVLHSGEDFFKMVDVHFGKARNDIFQLAQQTFPVEISQMRLAGSDHQFTQVARPNMTKATLDIIESWKWTGRKWTKI
jgi:hypothetical protein